MQSILYQLTLYMDIVFIESLSICERLQVEKCIEFLNIKIADKKEENEERG